MPLETVFQYLLSIPIVLFSLTVHEYCHGYAAYKLGDPTAKLSGRLSLNPLRHLDPIGALCMLLFHIGWAKPVPINTRYFRNPRRDIAITGLAGPASNLILSLIGVIGYVFCWKWYAALVIGEASEFLVKFAWWVILFFYLFMIMNLGLALFNLLPIPPLDGSRIIGVFLPVKWYIAYLKYERYISIGLLLFLLLDNYVLHLNLLSGLMRLILNGLLTLIGKIPFFADIAVYFLI